MTVVEDLKEFVIQNFLFGQDGCLVDDDSFLEKGIIDSTGVLELVSFIEEHFGIKMADSDLIPENLDSVNGIARFIESHTSGTRVNS